MIVYGIRGGRKMLKYQAKILIELVKEKIEIKNQRLDIYMTDNDTLRIHVTREYLGDLYDILDMLESEI